MNKKFLKQEDDDQVWNEVTKLRRENAKLTNENLSLHEKIDLQEVEISEQIIILGELRNEIQRLNNHQDESPRSPPIITVNNEQQQHLIEELDTKIYQLETERTNLRFEHERLKTNLDLCLDEKQHLIEQKSQTNNELKKSKLRILALQDQIHQLKRTHQLNNNNSKDSIPIIRIKRRMIEKKPKKSITTKSCLEMLLDQNATINDERQNESIVSNRRRQRSCSICDQQTENSFLKRTRQPSISSTISRKRCS